MLNPFLGSGSFCHLLITYANSLDPDQDQPNIGPDMAPNIFFEKVNFQKSQHPTTKAWKITQHAMFNRLLTN